MTRKAILVAAAAAFAIAGCGRNETAVTPAPAETATPAIAAAPAGGDFRAFMMNAVAPAVKPIWDFGYADNLTDENWAAIKKAAGDLAATIPTISSEARAQDPKWQDWTMKVSASADAAVKAATAKDQMGLQMAGDALVEQCEGCHMAFDPTAK